MLVARNTKINKMETYSLGICLLDEKKNGEIIQHLQDEREDLVN